MTHATLKRRWFQFGFATWFVLVAILAWGLAQRPYIVAVEHYAGSYVSDGEETVFKPPEHEQTPTLFGVTFYLDPDGDGWQNQHGVNPRLLWPLLALAGFVAWQASSRALAWRFDLRRNSID
jgi:hypothetical protein